MEGINGTLKIKDQHTNDVIGTIENYQIPITPDDYFTGYLIKGDVRNWLDKNGYDKSLKYRFLAIPDGVEEPAEW